MLQRPINDLKIPGAVDEPGSTHHGAALQNRHFLGETALAVAGELHARQQAVGDFELRLQDKDEQIRSLEEKHLQARDALEHYRNAVKEQREQEQRRHEGQLQQVQMCLNQNRHHLRKQTVKPKLLLQSLI